jgi:hypothetical protein
VNVQPHGDRTNSVAALVVHSCGVTEFWLGHVALAGEGNDLHGGREHLLDGDESDAAAVLHVLEEIHQHLGHMELTADALG